MKSALQDVWGLDLPKGCPCTPEVVCQARPALAGTQGVRQQHLYMMHWEKLHSQEHDITNERL